MQRWARLPILAMYGCYAAVQVHAWNQNMKLKIELISTTHTHMHSLHIYWTLCCSFVYAHSNSFRIYAHIRMDEIQATRRVTVRFGCSHFSWVERNWAKAQQRVCTRHIRKGNPPNEHGVWLYVVPFSALFVSLFHVRWRCLVNTKFTWTRENRIKVTVLCVCTFLCFPLYGQINGK